jgi:hypothetical protein
VLGLLDIEYPDHYEWLLGMDVEGSLETYVKVIF